MNGSKQPRQLHTCECGAKVQALAKFGNETMCSDCDKENSRQLFERIGTLSENSCQFLEWLGTLRNEELHEALLAVRTHAVEYGVMVTRPANASIVTGATSASIREAVTI